MATPHIEAEYGDFARTVLLPGDPKRSEFIAREYLTDARLVNDARGVKGYTGLYNGVPVSVMASGMGMPAVGIYAHELYNFYGVENIIRVGTVGALADKVKVKDIVIAMGAATDSSFHKQYELNGAFCATADYCLLRTAADIAEEKNAAYHVGNILSSDFYYTENGEKANENWRRMGILAIEMESAALYAVAARYNKRALSICTVSDHIYTGEHVSIREKESSFGLMAEIALETAVRCESNKSR